LVTALAAYLLGSIPAGFLAGKAKGIDIRTVGSGNIGATNAFRVLGKTAGTMVLVFDGLKGWAAVTFLPTLAHWILPSASWTPQTQELLRITAAVVVILGHNYTFWLKFKGGKGIATSAGVLAALLPLTFLIALVTWIVVCVATRYVSVASIVGALTLPVSTWFAHVKIGAPYTVLMVVIASLMSALAIYKHRPNIVRLMNGTENKIGRKKDAAANPTKAAP
jgi:glycerol-3-phosphate acyltransferase PlsY